MQNISFERARLSCAVFFMGPGLGYGILTSRLPFLKAQTGATEAEIGLILLCIGLSGLAALLASNRLLSRWGSRSILLLFSLVLPVAVSLCGIAPTPSVLGFMCILVGLSIGLCDVSMNTQGVMIERHFTRPALSLMHAAYSLGGVLGALSGALFAALGLGMLENALGVFILYLFARAWATKGLIAGSGEPVQTQSTRSNIPPRVKERVPALIYICALMLASNYASEGSVGEWGSLYLNLEKGAPEETAALTFGVFSTVTVLCRLAGDRIRLMVSDARLLTGGGLIALLAMLCVLHLDRPVYILIAYGFMGLGMSLMSPILFSRAGSCPGISSARAISLVSTYSYGALLLFPPLLGFAAEHSSIGQALYIVVGLCTVLTIGGLAFRTKRQTN